MDYEKKYEQALAKAKEQYNYPCMKSCMGILEEIFPEPKESDDEKIRKMLIKFFSHGVEYNSSTNGIYDKDIVAWLEKQGDNSNWHDGDVIRHGAILAIVIGGRRAMKLDGEKITIQYPDEWVKAQDEEREYFFEKLIEKQGEQKPALTPIFEVGDVMRTKEEATKGWKVGMPVIVSIDNEYYHCNNEIIAIKDQYQYEYPPINKQKPAEWSEEDENYCNYILTNCMGYAEKTGYVEEKGNKQLHTDAISWFKSLKDRVGCEANCTTTKAWSEEDIATISRVISIVKWAAYSDHSHPILNDEGATELVERLNSIKDKCTWKPSVEQINTLEYYMHTLVCNEHKEILFGLYTDLKKLKE